MRGGSTCSTVQGQYLQELDVGAVQLLLRHRLDDGDVALDLQLLLLIGISAAAPRHHVGAEAGEHAHHLHGEGRGQGASSCQG